MLKIAPAVWVGCSKASLQARSSTRSASAPLWECSVAPNSGSVAGLGFCRLLGAILWLWLAQIGTFGARYHGGDMSFFSSGKKTLTPGAGRSGLDEGGRK